MLFKRSPWPSAEDLGEHSSLLGKGKGKLDPFMYTSYTHAFGGCNALYLASIKLSWQVLGRCCHYPVLGMVQNIIKGGNIQLVPTYIPLCTSFLKCSQASTEKVSFWCQMRQSNIQNTYTPHTEQLGNSSALQCTKEDWEMKSQAQFCSALILSPWWGSWRNLQRAHLRHLQTPQTF